MLRWPETSEVCRAERSALWETLGLAEVFRDAMQLCTVDRQGKPTRRKQANSHCCGNRCSSRPRTIIRLQHDKLLCGIVYDFSRLVLHVF